MWPEPVIPHWAAAAGMPEPRPSEDFRSYVEAVGLNFEDLTVDLDWRTADLANVRLASRIQEDAPEAFTRYVESLSARWNSN